MKSIFDTCNIPSDGNELERAFPHPLLVNYTQTEEGWLKNQFRQFQVSVWPTIINSKIKTNYNKTYFYP